MGACPQPGCTGQVVDGYCNLCGNPPQVTGRPTSLLGTELSTTVTAAELGTVLIGSALAGPDSGRRPVAPSTVLNRIGAGITVVPAAPEMNPADAVLTNPVVPEDRRRCVSCQNEVGRGDEGAQGVCGNCQTPYDFHPAIAAGELVAGQYEVAGAIAYGGMGWVYLARDRNVSDRWVVLKGLINSQDADAAASAKTEREFLAAVEHPLIVEIYNFVKHQGERYIVMEYVPGRSITELLKERRAANDGVLDPLPVDWALAYVIEVLPAFSYLHSHSLLYCDFKPDNLMQVADSVKLIDLGAVRHMDDDSSPIFGTTGYQAPEVGQQGCSIASDIYTIGRALVVMSADFKGFQSTYVDKLPPVSKIEVFEAHDSFYRLIQRACAPVPEDRFVSAEELRSQAIGVLREVVGVSHQGAATTTHQSSYFAPPGATPGQAGWQQLPQLVPNSADPMHEWLSSVTLAEPRRKITVLKSAPMRTAAVLLTEIELALVIGDQQLASATIQEMLRADPWDWRAVWMQGVLAVRAKAWRNAQAPFNTVYSQVPGEVAPKYALAIACENGERPELAEELYAICAATDASYVTSSAFALTRLRLAKGDLAGAMEALELVPPTSRGYGDARQAYARLKVQTGTSISELSTAFESIAAADLDPQSSAAMRVQILERTMELAANRRGKNVEIFAGQPATLRFLRPRLEAAYQDMAKWSGDDASHREYMVKADENRRWSLW